MPVQPNNNIHVKETTNKSNEGRKTVSINTRTIDSTPRPSPSSPITGDSSVLTMTSKSTIVTYPLPNDEASFETFRKFGQFQKSKVYREILEENARREQTAFDAMNEDIHIGRYKNAYQKKVDVGVKSILTVKRETEKKNSTTRKGKAQKTEKKNRTTRRKVSRTSTTEDPDSDLPWWATDSTKLTTRGKSEITCPFSEGEGSDTQKKNKSEFIDWEFHYDKDDGTAENGNHSTSGGVLLTFLDMGNGSYVTPPYDTEDMRARNSESLEEDLEYLESEWRLNWTRKSDDERFEEALAHADRPLLVNWYMHGLEQWADLEVMKKHAAHNNCEYTVISEPIEVVEIRLNKALRTIAKYIAKFDYGEESGEKTMRA